MGGNGEQEKLPKTNELFCMAPGLVGTGRL